MPRAPGDPAAGCRRRRASGARSDRRERDRQFDAGRDALPRSRGAARSHADDIAVVRSRLHAIGVRATDERARPPGIGLAEEAARATPQSGEARRVEPERVGRRQVRARAGEPAVEPVVGLEAGVEDIVDDGDAWEAHVAPEGFDALQQAFDAAGFKYERAEISMVPQNSVDVNLEIGRKIVRLVDALDDNDDVQNVHGNFELPEELLAEMVG
jgi:hypothetical protein